jgi:pyruvate ferredoxin oxidoreductase gamma subunit/2-oxoisovalerate ferredoxin oxidoreductase gamma subunit
MPKEIIDVRFHGRGGQGVVTGARLLAEAALLEGGFVHSFPAFGPERAGAPITGFTRFSKEPFTVKTEVYEPEGVVVIDNTLLGTVDVLKGLQENGVIIVNHSASAIVKEKLGKLPAGTKLGVLDATAIAIAEIGRPIANTICLGSLVQITKWVKLENVLKSVDKLFRGAVAEKNKKAIQRASKEVKIFE